MSQPFPESPDIVPFYDLIGRIVIAWGRIERCIDITLMAGRQVAPDSQPEGSVWKARSKRMAAFKRICTVHPKTKDHPKQLATLMNHLRNAALVRDVLIHGYCHGITKANPPMIRFRSALYKPDGVVTAEFAKSEADLRIYLGSLGEIEARVTLFMMTVILARQRSPSSTPEA